MPKFENASDDVVKLFDEVRDETSIPQWIEFRVFCNNKQKKKVVKVVKSNDLVETLAEGVNFAVLVNESIFNELPDDLQKLAFIEKLAGVSVDENDAILYEESNFNTNSGVLQKHGHEPIIILHESIISLYDVKKQKEDEEKAANKGKRGRKKKEM